MPNKTVISNFNTIEERYFELMTHFQSPTFEKIFFLNLAASLRIKFPNPPDKYNLQSVIRHYSSFTIFA